METPLQKKLFIEGLMSLQLYIFMWCQYSTTEVQKSKQTGEDIFGTCLFGTKCKWHSNNQFISLESPVHLGSYFNVLLRWVNQRFIYHQWKYADLDGLDPLRKKNLKKPLLLSLLFCRHMSYEETIVRRQLLFVLVGK